MMKLQKKNGFSILAIILVIVAVIVMIGVWALSGSSNTSSASSGSNSILASTLTADSSSIKLAFDTIVVNGGTPENIVFLPNTPSNSLAPNMLDTINGIQLPNTSKKAFKDNAVEPNGVWTYNKNFSVVGVGTNSNDYAITIAGVKDSVCKAVNSTLYGSETIPVYGPANNSEGFVTGSTLSNPNTNVVIDFQSGGLSTAAQGWMVGCVGVSGNPDNNLFFQILKAR